MSLSIAEHTLSIDRSDTRPIAFRLKTGVYATTALDQTGSVFDLVIKNAKGAVVLTKSVNGSTGDVTFSLTLLERAAIPAGTSGRYELLRRIGGNQEIMVRGNIDAKGGA